MKPAQSNRTPPEFRALISVIETQIKRDPAIPPRSLAFQIAAAITGHRNTNALIETARTEQIKLPHCRPLEHIITSDNRLLLRYKPPHDPDSTWIEAGNKRSIMTTSVCGTIFFAQHIPTPNERSAYAISLVWGKLQIRNPETDEKKLFRTITRVSESIRKLPSSTQTNIRKAIRNSLTAMIETLSLHASSEIVRIINADTTPILNMVALLASQTKQWLTVLNDVRKVRPETTFQPDLNLEGGYIFNPTPCPTYRQALVKAVDLTSREIDAMLPCTDTPEEDRLALKAFIAKSVSQIADPNALSKAIIAFSKDHQLEKNEVDDLLETISARAFTILPDLVEQWKIGNGITD